MRARLLILVPGAAAVIGSFLVIGCGELTSDDDPDEPSPGSLESQYPEIAEEQSKPRFEGEVLGIRLGTVQALAEQGLIIDASKECPSGYETVRDDPTIPRPPATQPIGAFQPSLAPTGLGDEPNPGAIVCRDTRETYRSWRYLEFPTLPNGLVPSVLINRVFVDEPYRAVDGSDDRVYVTEIGGREVIAVPGVVREGGTIASASQVIVPEPGGYLVIQGDVLPWEDVLAIAEQVIASEAIGESG